MARAHCLDGRVDGGTVANGTFFSRLVGGAGDIKITKDGKSLLNEMVCQCQCYKE